MKVIWKAQVGLSYQCIYDVVFQDGKSAVLEAVDTGGRVLITRFLLDTKYVEYIEPKVYELTRAVMYDPTTDKMHLWNCGTELEGFKCFGNIKIKLIGDKLTVEVV